MFFYIKNFLTNRELDYVNKYIEDNLNNFIYLDKYDKQKSLSIIHNTNSIYSNEVLDLFLDLNKRVSEIIEEKFLVNVNTNITTLGSIVKYEPGMSLHRHVDNPKASSGNDIINKRSVSSIIYYNNNYDGGEIYFNKQGFKIKPDPGSILIFSSYQPYEHEVLPVIFGPRYITPSFWTLL